MLSSEILNIDYTYKRIILAALKKTNGSIVKAHKINGGYPSINTYRRFIDKHNLIEILYK